MTAGGQAAVPHVRRGLKWQLMGSAAWLGLSLLLLAPARESRFQAAFLLFIAVSFVLDGWGFRVNGAMRSSAGSPVPRWLRWATRVSYTLGAVLAVYGLVYFWHPNVAP